MYLYIHILYIYMDTIILCIHIAILGVSHPQTIGSPIQIHRQKIGRSSKLSAWNVAARSFSMIRPPVALRGGHGSFWRSEICDQLHGGFQLVMGVSNSWMVSWKSLSKMEDDSGYPYFRNHHMKSLLMRNMHVSGIPSLMGEKSQRQVGNDFSGWFGSHGTVWLHTRPHDMFGAADVSRGTIYPNISDQRGGPWSCKFLKHGFLMLCYMLIWVCLKIWYIALNPILRHNCPIKHNFLGVWWYMLFWNTARISHVPLIGALALLPCRRSVTRG